MVDDDRERRRQERWNHRGPALTMWRYDTPLGASAGGRRLSTLQARGALITHDAVAIWWMPGAHRPRIGNLRTMGGGEERPVLRGLVDHLVAATFGGAGAAADLLDLITRLAGTGVDGQFLEKAVARLVPGTSALLVLSSDADLDQVRPVVEHGLARGDVVLLHAMLADGAIVVLRRVTATARLEDP